MPNTFKDRQWRVSYKTSSVDEQGRPINVLREFYIPALSRTVTYDRVAGYFRSTSLAAASEGYSALLNRENGHIRLIVGADLDERDVQAILDGDEQRMTNELLHELEEPEIWDTNTQDGISLLSSMIACGRMELRVALRKNAMTGKAMDYDDTSDGYFHEKWFIMKDENGDRIGGAGSLNESRTALVLNAENVDVYCSWKEGSDIERIQEYESSFKLMWENKNPGFAVLSLPTAVRERLITVGNAYGKVQEIDERIRSIKKKPTLMDLLRFAVLKEAPYMPGGEMMGIYTAPVEPWPHQEIVARRLVETYPYSWMLCDEVGLGKTIESALAFRSLYMSGIAKRILIAAPKSLVSQWHRELHEKALLSFALSSASPKVTHEYIGQDRTVEDGRLFSPRLNIISTGLLAREKHEKSLSNVKENYDIALVDEAHYARRKNPTYGDLSPAEYGRLYRAIENTLVNKTNALWMATATPMQLHPIETWDLLRLTKRAGSYQTDPTLTLDYYGVLGKLVRGEDLTPEEWRLFGKTYAQIEISDPYLWKRLQTTCVDSRNSKVLKNLADYVQPVKHADRKYLNRPLFAVSPLSRVMMRHNRGLLEVYKRKGELNSNLAQRIVLPIDAISFTPTEKRLYDMLEEYCVELNRQIQNANENARTMMGFLLNFFQLRFASSIDAISLTLKRRLDKVNLTLKFGSTQNITTQEELDERIAEIKAQEDMDMEESDMDDITLDSLLKDRSQSDLEWEKKALGDMLAEYSSMHETPSKIQQLLKILDGRKTHGGRLKQTVLFTRFLDSLHSIQNHLKIRNPNLRVGVYSGQESTYFDVESLREKTVSHDEIKRLFINGEIDLLLCTDAAAEGLNLQTADLLINFDLGWNPMKIEQRIGRIDRIGQKYNEVFVRNMCYVGSTEEIVYGRLWERLKSAGLVVGTQQISLLPVEADDFRLLAEGKLTEDELEAKSKEKILEQKRINASLEISPEDQYEMYHKESSLAKKAPLPADLSSVWDAFERSSFMESPIIDADRHIWKSKGNESYPAIEGTTDRNEITEIMPLLSWGNTKLEYFLQIMEDELIERYPACIRKIETETYGRKAVAWLAALKNCETILIQNYQELKDVEIDENAVISEEAVSAGEKELAARIRKTCDPIQVRKVNAIYANAHLRLIHHCATYYLKEQANAGETSAWNAIKELEEAREIKNKRVLLPYNRTDFPAGNYLFSGNAVGDQVYMPVSDILYDCILSCCYRAIGSIKRKKTTITVDELIANIKRSYNTKKEQ